MPHLPTSSNPYFSRQPPDQVGSLVAIRCAPRLVACKPAAAMGKYKGSSADDARLHSVAIHFKMACMQILGRN
jgi:hypothetical protein